MKQETLKEAIKEHLYANAFAADPDNPGFVDRFIEHTKAAEWGAEWQRNHVWHDVDIEPTEKKILVVIDDTGEISQSNFSPVFENWEEYAKEAGIVKWCYRDSLLKTLNLQFRG